MTWADVLLPDKINPPGINCALTLPVSSTSSSFLVCTASNTPLVAVPAAVALGRLCDQDTSATPPSKNASDSATHFHLRFVRSSRPMRSSSVMGHLAERE